MSWKLGAIVLLVLGLVPAKGAQTSPSSDASALHALLAKGDYEGADRIYAKELAEHPGDFNLLYNRGLANYLAGHFEKSRELLLSVAPADRNKLNYQELLASVLVKLGDYRAAISPYQTTIKLAPSDPDNRLRLGALYLRLKLGQHATEVYTQGRRLFPQRPEFLLGLGVVQEMQAKFDSAIKIYRQVTEEYPKYDGGYLFLAHAELKSGQIEAAKKVADRFLAMNPDSALGHFYLAEASRRTFRASITRVIYLTFSSTNYNQLHLLTVCMLWVCNWRMKVQHGAASRRKGR